VAEPPLVVVIDDVPSDRDLLAVELEASQARAVPLHPRDVRDRALLARASLVVVDEYLTDWPEREALYRTAADPVPHELPLTMRPAMGVSVAAIVREVTAATGRATPIVLRTGEIDRLALGLPTGQRQHLFARQHDIEWLFDKNEPDPTLDRPSAVARMLELAAAADSVPGGRTDVARIAAWMELGEPPWADVARLHLARSRPPRNALTDASNGRDLLRWLLHQLLPYPAALLDRWAVAARLGVDPDSAARLPAHGFFAPLEQARYRGPLAGYLGPRWWRAGVDGFADDALPMPQARERGAAVAAAHPPAVPLDMAVPVPVLGPDLGPDGMAEDHDAVRILPDDWPAFADAAYARGSEAAREPLSLLRRSADSERWRRPKR